MLNTYPIDEDTTQNKYDLRSKERILKQLKQAIAPEFTTFPQRSTSMPTAPKALGLAILEELNNKLNQQKNPVAQLTINLPMKEKKTHTFVENNDMILSTHLATKQPVPTTTEQSAKKVPAIYELHATNGGFHSMSQDLTRFTDLSNMTDFETEENALGAEKQPSVALAVAEPTNNHPQLNKNSATERAKQAFQEYGTAINSPTTHPSASYSTFTATTPAPAHSVEQVIMEQQQTQPRKHPQLLPDFYNEMKPAPEAEFSSNVKTLIRLVNELPEGVTKQTGACIIRLTMEAMGIAMEEVLGEGQNAQSELLENVRMNIKKIEEYKTVIRKLETDIKYFQGRANELSEIIDLFILSNTSRNSIEA